jgi:hypothetical protein
MLATYGLQKPLNIFRKDKFSENVSFLYNGTNTVGQSFGTNIVGGTNISTTNGGSTVNAQVKFNATVLDCTNNKQWVCQSSAFDVGANNFSFEFFLYNISKLYAYNNGIDLSDSSTINYQIAFGHAAYGANNYQIFSPVNGVINTGVAITFGAWEFWQVIRNGAVINAYKNGVLIYSDNVGANFNWNGVTMNRITLNNNAGNNNFNGYCNGIRFTKIVNRPVANETGPFLYP